MTIYEMTSEWKMLMALIEDPDTDIQALKDTMEMIKLQLEEKVEGYGKVIANFKPQADALRDEGNRLLARAKTIENNIDRMKKAVQESMEETGQTKIKTEHFTFSVQNNPASVVIDDVTRVPKNFLIPQEPKIDKAAIKELLKETSVDWAHTEQTRGLRIR